MTTVIITAECPDIDAATLLVDAFNEWARHPDIEELFSLTNDSPSGFPETDYRISIA